MRQIITAILMLLAVSSPAIAKSWYSPKSDRVLALHATLVALEVQGEAHWRNPATGNSGRIYVTIKLPKNLNDPRNPACMSFITVTKIRDRVVQKEAMKGCLNSDGGFGPSQARTTWLVNDRFHMATYTRNQINKTCWTRYIDASVQGGRIHSEQPTCKVDEARNIWTVGEIVR